jgi:transposase
MWCIPKVASGDFVCAMEDVLDVYKRPYDEKRPVICMDETSKQLIEETRRAIPVAPGRPRRIDYEYRRHGVANIFMVHEPLKGRCQVSVTERRTKIDWAHLIQEMVDVHYPEAQTIVLVMDNLNTHAKGSLYETFEPTKAKRLAEKLEIHYTPKHGSWLNVAEIMLRLLSVQCLNRRIARMDDLQTEVAAWNQKRNDLARPVDWQFTTAKARTKLKRLYPAIQN